jgi:hypothetical protein
MAELKAIRMALKIRRLLKAGRSGDIAKIIDEVFSDAPPHVKDTVKAILSIDVEGKDPREIAREVGVKLGISEEHLDDFVDTIMMIAEEVKEFIKPEKE